MARLGKLLELAALSELTPLRSACKSGAAIATKEHPFSEARTWQANPCRSPHIHFTLAKPLNTFHVGEAPEIQAFLDERIYEYNSKATGYFDGESFSCTRRDESGGIRAGICGYTWGGCCYVSYLWVHESERRRGLGTALLAAAEEHAKMKRCSVVFLATHSFQAPVFYERLGYKARAVVEDHPVGHSSVVFAKRL